MKNLKILSMNLGRSFIPIKNDARKQKVTSLLEKGNYDIIMLQGDNLDKSVDFKHLGYIYSDPDNKKTFTLSNINFPVYNGGLDEDLYNSSIIKYKGRKLVCININGRSKNDMSKIFDVCSRYSNTNDENYAENRIIAGRLPREVDTNEFCDLFDLEDVSTFVGQETHIKNNREILNHLFVSRTLECVDIRKLVGMTEVSKLGEAYPIEASLSYKKVLK